MKKMIKYFLPITYINEISLSVAGWKIFFHHLIHHIGPEFFNTQKSVLYMEKSVIGQVIILNKSKVTWKIISMIATPNIKYN